jgi:hypothetical protein
MAYILLLLLLMTDLQISSNTNLWEGPSNILRGPTVCVGYFHAWHCYNIIFLNQLFSLSWRACEVHGTCKRSYTQVPSLSNQECNLVFETALHWASAHTYHNLVRQRQQTVLVHWPVNQPAYLWLIHFCPYLLPFLINTQNNTMLTFHLIYCQNVQLIV